MLISIITVTSNCINTIERTLKSVLSQTYPNVEYIIVDGASTDGTRELLEKYADKITVFVSEPDTGAYNAMNKAIGFATGDIIEFLNGDDYFYDDRVLERVAKEFEQNPDIDILVGKEAKDIVSTIHYPDKYSNVYIDAIFPHQAVFAKRRLFDEIGLFDEKYRICADRDWLLHAWSDCYIFRLVDDIYVYFEEGGSSFGEDTSLEEYLLAKKYLVKAGAQNFLPIAEKRCIESYANWHVQDFFKNNKWKQVQGKLWKLILGDKTNCIVWGQGLFGKLFIDSLVNFGYKIQMIIDMSLKGNEWGIDVSSYHPDLINVPVIVAVAQHDDELVQQMQLDGVPSERIITFKDVRKTVLDMIDDDHAISKHFSELTGLAFDLECDERRN